MILDGREAQMMLNPFELPTTSQPPNVNVTLAQVLRDRVAGELFQAPGSSTTTERSSSAASPSRQPGGRSVNE